MPAWENHTHGVDGSLDIIAARQQLSASDDPGDPGRYALGP